MWPYSGNWETRTPGQTVITAAWADAIDTALNGLYGGTRSVEGLALSASTAFGAVTRPGTGESKPWIYVATAPTVRQLVEQKQIGTGVWSRRYALLNGG